MSALRSNVVPSELVQVEGEINLRYSIRSFFEAEND